MRALHHLAALATLVVLAGCAQQPAVEPAAKKPVAGASQPTDAAPIARPSTARPALPKEPSAREPAEPINKAARGKGAAEFDQGVKSYEDGDYKGAARRFQAALHDGLDGSGDKAGAHKYLAFIACAAGRERTCRDEFRKAFAADASFDLAPAEAGHPIWGPAFRRVKAELAAKRKPKP